MKVTTSNTSSKTFLMFYIGVALLAALTIAGCTDASATTEENHREQDHKNVKHEEPEAIKLSKAEIDEFNISLSLTGPANMDERLELAGEIVPNADRLAHVNPPVQGIVRQVRRVLGDRVKAGETLAIIESRELAQVKQDYLAAAEMLALKKANYRREKSLFDKKISSEQEYLDAKQARAEAAIAFRSAERKLHALGFSEKYISRLKNSSEQSMARYDIRSPIAGTIISKHAAIGEVVDMESELFIVADLTKVWVQFVVYQKDLAALHQDQIVQIHIGSGHAPVTGSISYISQTIDSKTRTAVARVVLDNPDGIYRPGLFVTGKVRTGQIRSKLAVSRRALQEIEGKTCVFVKDGDTFKSVPVRVGRVNGQFAEILEGLKEGQKYVSSNAFVLKAQMEKESFGEGHGH